MTNRVRVLRSLDVRRRVWQMGIYLCLLLLLVLGGGIIPEESDALRAVWLLDAVLLGCILYHGIRTAALIVRAPSYRQGIARYKAVHFRRTVRGYASFSLTVEREDGSVFDGVSGYVFPTSALSRQHLGQYLDVPLEVLYRDGPSQVIVVGKAPDTAPHTN